jgi:hypothetical protein
MSRTYACVRVLLLAAVVAVPVASMGCVVRARATIYDPYQRDYHRWDDREQRAYRQYWGERKDRYRDYKKLNEDQKRDYWDWRHHHPDDERR